MALRFEWDKRKASVNLRKHGVSFEEAVTIFGDLFSRTIRDDRHSDPGETRFVTIGTSARNRLLVVVHLDSEECIRLISARKAAGRERKDYEGT